MDSSLVKLEQNATTSGDEQLAKKIENVPEADLDDVDGGGACGLNCFICVQK